MQDHAENAKSCRKMQALQNGQFPCLGPAAVVAVNSVDVEVTSSGVPVKGGEVSYCLHDETAPQ